MLRILTQIVQNHRATMYYPTAWKLPEERNSTVGSLTDGPLIRLNSVKGTIDHISEVYYIIPFYRKV